MQTITIKYDTLPGQTIGIEEAAEMFFEQFGDTKVAEVREDALRQLEIGGERQCGG